MKKSLFLALFMSVVLNLFFIPVNASADDSIFITTADVTDLNDGVLTLKGGREWYRVRTFEDNNDYIITVKDSSGRERIIELAEGDSEYCVWHYSRRTMVSSMTPERASLTAGNFSLVCSGSVLEAPYTVTVSDDMVWEHYGSVLRYSAEGKYHYLRYNESSDTHFVFTDNEAEASEVELYTRGETLERCIISQPVSDSYVIENSGYPAPVFTVGLTDVAADSIKWYIDGEEQPCTAIELKAEALRDRPAGVHRISCLVEAHDGSGVHYRERSAEAAFVIAKGVMPDSILTFSDIHEEYGLISSAIGDIIERTGGYIPSLVICSGDFVNGPTPTADKALKKYYPQIISALGGLDAVFVAGNHDPAEAASIMSAAAGLGVEKDLSADGGVIFRGSASETALKGRNSRSAKGITVYGINFSAVNREKDGELYNSYENVIADMRRFLEAASSDYHGELIVISAHSGLHVLGEQPESVNRKDIQLSSWIGENSYNIDMSYELAQLINSYASMYDMDIVYLFGHDHSRNEKEMFLTDGDTLISTRNYADRSYDSQELSFTYAHAGYLSSQIGCADKNYAFIYRDGDKFSYDLISLTDNSVEHSEFKAKSRFVAPVTESTASAVTTAAVTSTASGLSGESKSNPATGDDLSFLLLAAPAFAGLLISRKPINKRLR